MPKIKILKINIFNKEYSYNYGDDYGNIATHLINSFTDFEEVTKEDYQKISIFLSETNSELSHKKSDYYYMLINEEERIGIKETLDAILAKEKKRKKENEERRKKEEELAAKKKAEYAAKKIERAKKKYEQLQKDLGLIPQEPIRKQM